jgi:hypothetical protein
VGVVASRPRAWACERHWAFRATVGEERPDVRTISDFRTLPLEAFKALWGQVGRFAGEAGVVPVGNVATDGTNIQGHASRHQALSYGEMQQDGGRLREAIETWGTQADWQEATDEAACGSRRGAARPDEVSRRAPRLATLAQARRRLEAHATRAAEAEWQRRAEAEAERQRQGAKRRGREPKPVEEGPEAKAPLRLTDAERHSMRTPHPGWDSGGNAPASVDEACPIIVACDVTDETPDTKPAEPLAHATLESLAQAGLERPTDDTGAPTPIAATWDKGYDSEAAARALEAMGFEPYRAAGRVRQHDEPHEAPEAPTTAQERLALQVRSAPGRALYARRKVIVEPVFGQSKEGRGFRRFTLRGLTKMRGAWCVVCLTHPLLKIWRYGCVPMTA